jgi:hypothetical protein
MAASPLLAYAAHPIPPNVGSEAPPREQPPEAAAAREIVFTNLLRKAVVEYYGSVAYYFRVLRVNGLQGAEAYTEGDEVTMPPRANAAALAEAERWRAKLGERA